MGKSATRASWTRITGTTLLVVLAILLVIDVPTAFASGEKDDITKMGDFFQIFLPLAGWGSTFIAGDPYSNSIWDKEGTKQATLSIGSSILTTYFGKFLVAKSRPSLGGSLSSFPSGHTNAAFAGASFIERRYGWWWGAPAYACAVFTAWSRVRADAHFADDVTAGASIALLYTWLFVTPQSQSLQVMPEITEDGVAVSMEIGSGKPGEETRAGHYGPSGYKWRFDFAFGPAFLIRNEITSPSETGTTFDLYSFEKLADPTTTAVVDVGYYPWDRHEFLFSWSPFESRDKGKFAEPTNFNGVEFPPDSTMRSAWRLYDLRARWTYNLGSGRWDLRLGGGLAAEYMSMKLSTDDGSLGSEVSGWGILPFGAAEVLYRLNKRFSAQLNASGVTTGTNWMMEAGLFLSYWLGDNWDLTLGYQYLGRDIHVPELTNLVDYNIPYISISYSW
jgi:membrane-associated phospholipid phosphatase